MAHKNVTIIKWSCDGCSEKALTDTRDMPPQWTDSSTVPFGYSNMALELCPQCSLDPAAAIERWKATHS